MMVSLLAGVKVKNCIGASSVIAIKAEAVSATSGVVAPSAERAAARRSTGTSAALRIFMLSLEIRLSKTVALGRETKPNLEING